MMKLIVDNGRVNCPRRGDLDIDLCFDCPDLRDVTTEDDHPVLVCKGRRPSYFGAADVPFM